MPKNKLIVDASEAEKMMLFKLAARSADNTACGELFLDKYKQLFDDVFDIRLKVMANAYFRFKEEYIHEV